jgi:hypothetical protein
MNEPTRWDHIDESTRIDILKDMGYVTRRNRLSALGKEILLQCWTDFTPETRRVMLEHGVLYG